MIKRDLVIRISEETGIPQQDVLAVIQKLFGHIAKGLAAGERFEFRDFGVFAVVTRKARIGRNPNKPANTVTIPPRKVVKFKPGKEMRELVLASRAS